MKAKLIFTFVTLFVTTTVSSQVMRTEELEKYAKERYGGKWTEAAENLVSQLSLDKNKSLTYEQVIDCGESTKEQLYVILNYWFAATFNDANSVIKLNDKELGTIIAEGHVSDIADHMGGANSYNINIRPIIKVDIKDKRIRVTYTVQYYNVEKLSGGGILSAVSESLGALSGSTTQARKELLEEHWGLETCFPFAKKDGHKAKKTSSKALVMTHAYSNIIMDKIEEAVKNGLIGNENNDW